jgi:lysophospholipase L1-like esterase
MRKLVCFGDSHTAKEQDEFGNLRLTPRLRQGLPDWNIINSGVGGDNTRKALKRLQTDVLVHNPDLVTVLIGTADASEQKHVDIQEYQENLSAIVSQISPAKTILISSPPIDYERLLARKQAFPMANMVTMQELKQYVLRATEVAKQAGCYFIDLWSEMHGQSNYTRFLHPKDGVHFNEQGYEFLSGLILQKVRLMGSCIL